MQITKSPVKNLDVGGALREHIQTRLSLLQQKYFDATVHANVTVEKQRGFFLTDCALHLATGLVLQAEGKGRKPTQLRRGCRPSRKAARRYKQRLKDHHRDRREPVRHSRPRATSSSRSPTSRRPGRPGRQPVVIAETGLKLPELSVGEAVMQLDISTQPFLLFRNGGHGGLNLVYRRPDGNIGWVDPKPAA